MPRDSWARRGHVQVRCGDMGSDRGHRRVRRVFSNFGPRNAGESRRVLGGVVGHLGPAGVQSVYFSKTMDGTSEDHAAATGTPEAHGLDPEWWFALNRPARPRDRPVRRGRRRGRAAARPHRRARGAHRGPGGALLQGDDRGRGGEALKRDRRRQAQPAAMASARQTSRIVSAVAKPT